MTNYVHHGDLPDTVTFKGSVAVDSETMGLDPQISTPAKPGSDDKVMMLAARYAAGLPLWHKKDCYDHEPPSPVE